MPQPNQHTIRGLSALERFARKCRFDPATGCVLWIGGTSAGRGNTALYGRFWDGEKMHYAHRWSARNIHGLEIDDYQVGHCCPAGPNTLCVQHLEPQTQLENLKEQSDRRRQSSKERQFWLFVQLGIEPAPGMGSPIADDVPFFTPPAWLRPFLKLAENDDDCPF